MENVEYQKNWAKNNPEKIKKYRQIAKTPERKEKRRNWERKHYQKNKDKEEFIIKRRKKANKWSKNNRQKYKEQRKRYYNKNKLKVFSRVVTRRVLKFKNIPVLINFSCKKCGSVKNLQIHHEIYPTSRKEIRQAIKEGKIYFLCKKHHRHNKYEN